MSNVDIHKAQQILYAWLSNFDKRSYETIRLNCESISKSLGLNLEGKAHWYIFYPLLVSGTIEYAGKDYYALSSSSNIHTGEYTIYVNPSSEITNAIQTKIPGLYISKKDSTIEAIVFDSVSALKAFPDIESVVNNFHNVVVDLSDAEYYMHWKKKGLTKRFKDGIIRYFHIPEKVFIKEVPSKRQNPDAFNIAYSYSRAICNEQIGSYSQKKETLRVKQFGFPIMLYRVLLIETLAGGIVPIEDNGEYIFQNIPLKIVKELNRILCNTISV